MKKLVKKLKKTLVLFIVFLLCLDSFASVLVGHDGKAFITKGEFDEMKASFRDDINNYFSSIDNKMEGAIAEYLAGITFAGSRDEQILYFKHCTAPSVYCRKYTDMQYNYADPRFELDLFFGANLIDASKPYSKMAKAEFSSAGVTGASRMYVKSFLDATGSKKYYYTGFTNDIAIHRVVTWICVVKNGWGGSYYFNSGNQWYFNGPNFNIGDYTEVKATDDFKIYSGFATAGDGRWTILTPSYSNLNSFYDYTIINQNDFLFDVNTTEEGTIYFFDEDLQGIAYTQNSFTNRLESDWWNTLSASGQMCLITNSTTGTWANVVKGGCLDTSHYVVEDAPTDVRYWADLYNSDMTKYTYEDDSDVTQEINTYPLNAGIPIAKLEKGKTFEWNVFFEDADQHNMYFFWGPNTGSLDATNTIPIKVDDGTATWQPEIGQNGKVSFKADRNGILFAKWRSTDATISAGINVDKSYYCRIYDEE